ncbi:MAG: ABC transporter substrate-binding protein [Anaerolineae bacterium]|nr:ABC transporter substrate-binding protein [Anaerolineae bacterium]
MKRHIFFSIAILVALVAVPSLLHLPASATPSPSTFSSSGRRGAWLDAVVFTAVSNPSSAISQLQANSLDVYASSVGPELFQRVLEDDDLTYSESYSPFNDLTFNPYGPNFRDGRLNPFWNYKIREAMNWLVDRNYIAQVIFRSLAVPKWVPVSYTSADYARYRDAIRAIEEQYAYDPSRARAVISTEMQNMGASLRNGVWHYGGRPITITVLIRIEDERLQIGNYVANQLESVGFTVDRQYKNWREAAPIWLGGNPADGFFHIYTGGWIDPWISRDEGSNFAFFYTPLGLSVPLWQAYQPSPEFDQIAKRLMNYDFSSMAERSTLFTRALTLAMNDTGIGSVRIWLVHEAGFAPRREGTIVASDLVGGIAGADMWPFVTRFAGQEGGTMRIAQSGLLIDPWNPVAGSNWVYDAMPIRATQDDAFLADPRTGLQWPQRAITASVVVRQGLPVTKTLDWVSLSFVPQINVPADAWVDWDAASQRFITRAEKYPGGLTATVKTTVVYPSDLFTNVTWHDGSPLDLSDFVIKMILTFDRGKPESAIYDQSAVSELNDFLSHFRGVRIVSENPLVIETYDNLLQLDAELLPFSWWPNYNYGPGAWHTLAIGIRAEAAGALAFSSSKANSLGVPWMDYVKGPSLAILQNYLNQSANQNYIPYAPTLSAYITSAEAASRWANLQAWYANRGHFWVGTGPFYLESVSPNVPMLTLRRYSNFPDLAGRWDAFAVPDSPDLQINYSEGAPGSYFNVTGSGFPPNRTAFVLANDHILGQMSVNPDGTIAFTLSTGEAQEGEYHLRVSVNPAAGVPFTLTATAPVREREGDLPVIEVPAGLIKFYTYLPLVMRRFP